MTAITAAQPEQPSQQASRWLEQRYVELLSRANACFARYRPERREEAVAEVLAITVAAVVSAARRGVLHRLTPFWCVLYAARQLRAGRCFAGSSSRCVLSPATQARHGIRVVSLDQPIDPDADRPRSLRDLLADQEAESPLENVRRHHDYQAIFDQEAVSPKARTTAAFLAATHGTGRQTDLAAELKVTPGRITQLKGELAEALGRHGYAGPLGPRPGGRMRRAG